MAFLWSWSSASCYSCNLRSCSASRSFSSFRACIPPRVPSRSCCYYILLSCSKESSASPQPSPKCNPPNTPAHSRSYHSSSTPSPHRYSGSSTPPSTAASSPTPFPRTWWTRRLWELPRVLSFSQRSESL